MKRTISARAELASVTGTIVLGIFFGPSIPPSWTSNINVITLLELQAQHVFIPRYVCMRVLPTGGENVTRAEVGCAEAENGNLSDAFYYDGEGIGAANEIVCSRATFTDGQPLRLSQGIWGRGIKNAGIQSCTYTLSVFGVIVPRGELQA